MLWASENLVDIKSQGKRSGKRFRENVQDAWCWAFNSASPSLPILQPPSSPLWGQHIFTNFLRIFPEEFYTSMHIYTTLLFSVP